MHILYLDDSGSPQNQSVIHGLIHKRPRNEPCTCPSCLTRPRRLESTASAR
jgi:hypothetical protein